MRLFLHFSDSLFSFLSTFLSSFIVYSLNPSIALLGIGQKTKSFSQSFALPVLVVLRLILWYPHLHKVNKKKIMINVFVKLVQKLEKRYMMVESRKQCRKQLSRCDLKCFKTGKHYLKGCVKATGVVALRVININ